jgi:hypothetical protein
VPSSRCRRGARATDLPLRTWTLRRLILCDRPVVAIAGRRSGYRWGDGLSPCHRRNKAVAAPGNRLDAAALSAVLIEDAAQRRDLDRQIAFLDYRSGPHGLHDRIFRNQLPWPLDQQAEQAERTRANHDRYSDTRPVQPEQIAADEIETEAFEEKNVSRIEPVHALVSRQFRCEP